MKIEVSGRSSDQGRPAIPFFGYERRAFVAARLLRPKRKLGAKTSAALKRCGAAPGGQPKTDHFGQLRPGVKRVLQLRAYLAGALLASALGGGSASADDAALYGPVAPPGSAFVRVFNPSAQEDLDAQVADKTMTGIEAYSASEFVFLPAGQYTLKAGNASESVSLKKDRYYTAVPSGQGFKLFDNDGTINRLKALVIVYNLTDKPVSLTTAQGQPVIENVAPEKSGTRSVNPVKTSLALASGGGKVGEVKPMSFERGKAFSLFVLPAGGQALSVWSVPKGES